jgi:hypothetical protein
MQTLTHPVEGWVDAWASYRLSIRGSLIMDIRDEGPFSVQQVLAAIKRYGIGADVRKASPTFDEDDGAQRILNFLLEDVDVILHAGDDGYFLMPHVTEFHSKLDQKIVTLPTKEARQKIRDDGRRETHLRQWVYTQPFSGIWRDGLRRHSTEEVVALASLIEAMGYAGMPIIRDQNGVIIDGHLRAQALTLLGRDPEQYTEERFFYSDMHRLAFVIAVHNVGGHWPADLRKEIVRFVNKAATRTGVKMHWPDDIPMVTANQEYFEGPSDVEDGEKETTEVRAASAPRIRSKGGPLSKGRASRGSKVAFAMMALLEAGQPSRITQLDPAYQASVFWNAKELYGWVILDDSHRYSLTPLGREAAVAIWQRDRPMRNLPV